VIDKQPILTNTDLLSLAKQYTSLRKVASTHGGEYAGPCPICGGEDRFRIQPTRNPWGMWFCRNCTGERWHNAIDLVMMVRGISFPEACKALTDGKIPTTSFKKKYKKPIIQAYSPPEEKWQTSAQKFIMESEEILWGPNGRLALDYLRTRRGLHDDMTKDFHLGFHPTAKPYDAKSWGFDEYEKLYIEKGIVIPCIVANHVWYIKIRTNSNNHKMKYRGIKGNRTAAIFNADELRPHRIELMGENDYDHITTYPTEALFCEGEFDCMIASQELGGVIPIVTFGAANNTPDLATWGPYLLGINTILSTYDNDEAGQKGSSYLAKLSNRVHNCQLPD
jgi:DNA primase